MQCGSLARPHIAVELAADPLLLAAATGWILLKHVAPPAAEAGGIVLPHLLLQRAFAGADSERLRVTADIRTHGPRPLC